MDEYDEPTDIAPQPGRPLSDEPTELGALPPLPDELAPHARRRLWLIGGAVAMWALGLVMGLMLAPDTPASAREELTKLRAAIKEREVRMGELEQLARAPEAMRGPGRLPREVRSRLEKQGKHYANSLKHTGAQGASHLMQWFVGRWLDLIDYPQEDDRINRRAATLALLVGGMAQNLNPGDYIPWQAEVLNNTWLPEVNVDTDGDGLPGSRARPNTHDGFAQVSVCHVAMALNQALTDAKVLMMPEMRCDRPDSRMSVFLHGATFDDALNEFVRAAREHGFLVVERNENKQRLILVGARPVKAADDD